MAGWGCLSFLFAILAAFPGRAGSGWGGRDPVWRFLAALWGMLRADDSPRGAALLLAPLGRGFDSAAVIPLGAAYIGAHRPVEIDNSRAPMEGGRCGGSNLPS